MYEYLTKAGKAISIDDDRNEDFLASDPQVTRVYRNVNGRDYAIPLDRVNEFEQDFRLGRYAPRAPRAEDINPPKAEAVTPQGIYDPSRRPDNLVEESKRNPSDPAEYVSRGASLDNYTPTKVETPDYSFDPADVYGMDDDQVEQALKQEEANRAKWLADNNPAVSETGERQPIRLRDIDYYKDYPGQAKYEHYRQASNDRKKSAVTGRVAEISDHYADVHAYLDSAEDNANTRTAKAFAEDTRRLAEAPSSFDGRHGFANFAKGMGEGLTDIDTYTAGVTDLIKMKRVQSVAEKMGAGEYLTDDEQALLRSYCEYLDMQEARTDLPMGYQAGKSTAESVPFTVQMMLTAGAGALATRGLLKAAQKFGTEATAKKMAGWLGKKVSTVAGKTIVEDAAEGLVRQAGRAAAEIAIQTAVMPGTYSGIAADKVDAYLDGEDYNFLDFARSFSNAMLETATEKSGFWIEKGLGKVTRIVAPGNRASRIFGDYIQSPVGEFTEELVASPVNLLRSLNPLYDKESNQELRHEAGSMWSPEQLGITFLSVLPMSLVGAGAHSAAAGWQRTRLPKTRQGFSDLLQESGATAEQAGKIISSIESETDLVKRTQMLQQLYNSMMTEYLDREGATESSDKAKEFDNRLNEVIGGYNKSLWRYDRTVDDVAARFAELPEDQKQQAAAEFEANVQRLMNNKAIIDEYAQSRGVTADEVGKAMEADPEKTREQIGIYRRLKDARQNGAEGYSVRADERLMRTVERIYSKERLDEFAADPVGLISQIEDDTEKRNILQYYVSQEARKAYEQKKAEERSKFEAEKQEQYKAVTDGSGNVVSANYMGGAVHVMQDDGGTAIVVLADGSTQQVSSDQVTDRQTAAPADLLAADMAAYDASVSAVEEAERNTPSFGERAMVAADLQAGEDIVLNVGGQQVKATVQGKGTDGITVKYDAPVVKTDGSTRAVEQFTPEQLAPLLDNDFALGRTAESELRQTTEGKLADLTLEANRQAMDEFISRIGESANVEHIASAEEAKAKNVPGYGASNAVYHNGKTYIFDEMFRDKTRKQSVETVIHELVAHSGTRALLGTKFDSVMDRVWRGMDDEMKGRFTDYAMIAMLSYGDSRMKGYNEMTDEQKAALRTNMLEDSYVQRMAADEYVAHLAEGIDLTDEGKTIWQEIIDAVTEFINSMLDKEDPMTRPEVEQLIRSSYKAMRARRETGAGVNAPAAGQTVQEAQTAAAVQEVQTPAAGQEVQAPAAETPAAPEVKQPTRRERLEAEYGEGAGSKAQKTVEGIDGKIVEQQKLIAGLQEKYDNLPDPDEADAKEVKAHAAAKKALGDAKTELDRLTARRKEYADALEEINAAKAEAAAAPEGQAAAAPRRKPSNGFGGRRDPNAAIQDKFQEERSKFQNADPKTNIYAKVLQESETWEDAAAELERLAKEQDAIAEDWASRKYKTNNAVVTGNNANSAADEYATTIGAANERRRRAAVSNARKEAENLRGYADTLRKRVGAPAAPKTEEQPAAEAKTGTGTAPETKETPKQTKFQQEREKYKGQSGAYAKALSESNSYEELAANLQASADRARAKGNEKSAKGYETLASIAKGRMNDVADDGMSRFQLIGQAGAARLDAAEEKAVRMDNLKAAAAMEAKGLDSERIWFASGWQRGADGKWRYEIPDGKFTMPDLRKRFAEHAKNPRAFKYDESTFTLPELYGAPALYEAYPGLKNTTVRLVGSNVMPRNELGSYNPIDNEIKLNVYDLKQLAADWEAGRVPHDREREEAYSEMLGMVEASAGNTLIHEIQHAIQTTEGFAQGGSPKAMDPMDHSGLNFSKRQNAQGEELKRLTDFYFVAQSQGATLGEVLQQEFVKAGEGNLLDIILKAHSIKDIKGKINLSKDEKIANEQLNAILAYYMNPDATEEDRADKYLNSIDGADIRLNRELDSRDPFEMYQALAGEVEARNAAKRSMMTENERKFESPRSTEDTKDEDQIVKGTGERPTDIFKYADERHRSNQLQKEIGLDEETADEFAAQGLTASGGVILNKEAAQLKKDTGYKTPNEDVTRFSHVTYKNGGREIYLSQDGAELRVSELLDGVLAQIESSPLLQKFLPAGVHKSSEGKDLGPLRTNDEYKYTFDLDTSCPRTFELLNLCGALEKKLGRHLSQKEIVQVTELMRMNFMLIPCTYCYAENKRQVKKEYTLRYLETRLKVLGAKNEAEARKVMYGHSKGKGNVHGFTSGAYKTLRKWRDNEQAYRPSLEEYYRDCMAVHNYLMDEMDKLYEEGRISLGKAGNRTDDAAISNIMSVLYGIHGLDSNSNVAVRGIVDDWLFAKEEGKNPPRFKVEPKFSKEVTELWSDAEKYGISASSAKARLKYVPYTNELSWMPQDVKDYVNGMGGMRMHSSNDFRIDYFFDYLQLVADMAAQKMKGHTYTKQPDFVKLFGRTGIRINMSIAAYEDADGNIIPNVQEGFEWDGPEGVKELRKKYKNAGAMFMVTSINQLQFALDSDWVDMIIPFHESGLSKSTENIMAMRNWTNFTGGQSEKALSDKERKEALKAAGVNISGKGVDITALYDETFGIEVLYDENGKRMVPHFFPGETKKKGVTIPGHNNDKETYMNLCRKYGVKPRFQGVKVKDANGNEIDVTEHPGYMKLIKETARIDSEQTSVQFNLDEYDDNLGMTPLEYGIKKMQEGADEAARNLEQIKSGVHVVEGVIDNYGVVDDFLKHYVGKNRPLKYVPEDKRELWKDQNQAYQKKMQAWSEEHGVEASNYDAFGDGAKDVPYHTADATRPQLAKDMETAQTAGDVAAMERIMDEAKAEGTRFQLANAGTYFSGGGLLEQGLRGAISPMFAVEYDERIAGVYRNNNGDHVITADVVGVDLEQLAGMADGNVQYFHASPVCKRFSAMNRQAEETGVDVSTAKATADALERLRPEVFTLENVPGYRSSEALQIITDKLDELGYTYDADVYNAADFGAYTSRGRYILRAVRDGELPARPKTTGRTGEGWMSAVEDLIPTLEEKEDGLAPWMQKRLKEEGVDVGSLKEPLFIADGTPGTLRRAYASELLPAITTRGSDVILMPDGRVLKVSARMLARITGLADDYALPSSETLAHKIIGNGIPVKLTQGVIAPLLSDRFGDGGTRYQLTPNYLHRDEVRRFSATRGKIDSYQYNGFIYAIKANPLYDLLNSDNSPVGAYRRVVKDITLDNYFIGTAVDFKPVIKERRSYDAETKTHTNNWEDIAAEWDRMKESGRYTWHKSPLSDSEYLTDEKTGDIYRCSDHWGGVASCDWTLDGVPSEHDLRYGRPYVIHRRRAIAKANIKDFTLNGKTTKDKAVDPARSAEYGEALNQTLVNYRALRDGNEYQFTQNGRSRLEQAIRELEALKVDYDAGGIEAVADREVRYQLTPKQAEEALTEISRSNAKAYDPEVGTVRFQITKRTAESIDRLLAKNPNIDARGVAAFKTYVEHEETPAQLAMAKWFGKGSIRLPEDKPLVDEALKTCRKMKMDPMAYNGPGEIVKDWYERIRPEVEDNSKLLKPEAYPDVLTNKVDYGNGITVYNVADTREGQQAVRDLMNDHLTVDGRYYNCWCLEYCGESTGELTDAAIDYWGDYSACPKRVAFYNGRIVAFCASADSDTAEWWDLSDNSHGETIPVTMPIPGDTYARSSMMEFDASSKELTPVGGMFSGNKKNGLYREWNPKGVLVSSAHYKGRKLDGLYEIWNGSGQMTDRVNFKDGKKEGTYEKWYDDGTTKRLTHYRDGKEDWIKEYYPNGAPKFSEEFYDANKSTAENWYENGQLKSRSSYINGERNGLYEEWYENGQIKGRADLVNDECDGLYEEWHENGQLSRRETFDRGEPDGLAESWYANGKRNSLAKFDLGVETAYIRWDTGGDLLFTRLSEAEQRALVEQADAYDAEMDQMEADALADEIEANEVRYSLVEDADLLERLNNGEAMKVYRAAQIIDGEIYPPMSAKVKGKFRAPIRLGRWEQSEENPEIADDKGYFPLNKGNGKTIRARYNPYFHSSPSPLNDQFSSAYERPNLIVMEVEVPVSELKSKFRAVKAKDTVGMKNWHAGPVSGKLPDGKKRTVMLSRWDRPIRIVPDSEVAALVADLLAGENLGIPRKVVTPSLAEELKKHGVRIVERNKDVRLQPTPDETTRFQLAQNETVVQKQARDRYEQLLQAKLYKMTENHQDSMRALLELQRAVSEAYGRELEDYENAYIHENAMSSKNKYQSDEYRRNYVNPLEAAVKKLIREGETRQTVIDYMMAKHGLERNAYMQGRVAAKVTDALVTASSFDLYIAAAQTRLAAAKTAKRTGEVETLARQIAGFQRDRAAAIKEASDLLKKHGIELDDVKKFTPGMLDGVDFAGLTQLTGDKEHFTELAGKMVEDFEKDHDAKDLWTQTNQATKKTLAVLRDGGVLSQASYEAISKMYENYIPLRGWDDKVAHDVWEYVQDDTGRFGSVMKDAGGRKSKADDPIAVIAWMGQRGIQQANRNAMKQKLLNLALNMPTDLMTVSDTWIILDPDKGEWRTAVADAGGKETVAEFEARMQKLELQGLAKRVRGKLDVPYRILPMEERQHAVIIQQGDKSYTVYINSDPRAAEAINGLLNPDIHNSPLMQKVDSISGDINRFLASNFTQRNPEFVLRNLSRDLLFSNFSVFITEDAKYRRKFLANQGLAAAKLPGLLHRRNKGKLDRNNPMDRMYLEFLENGGETGYTNIITVEENKRRLERIEKDGNSRINNINDMLDVLASPVDNANAWAEGICRFAAFLTSRESGRGIARSVWDAKDISVNFNKKGSGGDALSGWMRMTHLFYNAAVQGMAKFARMVGANPKRAVPAMMSLALGGFLIRFVNQWLSSFGGDGDPDDYYDLPETVRRNNICLAVGGTGKFITVPLSIEQRTFYGMGELLASWMAGKEKYDNPGLELVGMLADLTPVNPEQFVRSLKGKDLGGKFAAYGATMGPDALRTAFQLMNNEDYFGIPIYRKNDFNENLPAYRKAYKSTGKTYVSLAKFLNDRTGGNEYRQGGIDLNPAVAEHILESYFGGIYKTIEKGVNTAAAWVSPEDEVQARKMPIVSSFLSDTKDSRVYGRTISNAYYQYKEKVDRFTTELNGFKKEMRTGKDIEAYARHLYELNGSPDAEAKVWMDQYAKQLDYIRKMGESGLYTEEQVREESLKVKEDAVFKLESIYDNE